ncbi:hypothetical protein BpHYR1_041571 [Brachionus plicatilis]|uniref:Uncharacterized protein n=1 Tax=Brachionus plicatilis TaxID=10195 RepID=A0A3M7SRE5_BRAPC|nr:hypothetical protein BpHYR1_041571 [Brachionus plicatilis]
MFGIPNKDIEPPVGTLFLLKNLIKPLVHIPLESIYKELNRNYSFKTARIAWSCIRMKSKQEPARIFSLYESETRHGQAKRDTKNLSYKCQKSTNLTSCPDKLKDEELVTITKNLFAIFNI